MTITLIDHPVYKHKLVNRQYGTLPSNFTFLCTLHMQ